MSDTLRDREWVGTPVSEEDLPFLALVFGDDEVGKTLGGTRSVEEVLGIYTRWRDIWEAHRFGPFAFRTSGDRFVGYSGVAPTPHGEPGDIELLYAVLPEFWGAGVATRISRLVVDWTFHRHKVDTLVAYTLTTNHASMGVMKKLGFVYERDIEKAGLPHVFYRLSRARWSGSE